MGEILARRFGLRYEPTMQDWELEVCDSRRVSEFLEAYGEFDAPWVKASLVELVAFSYDDYVGEFGRDLEIEKKLLPVMVSEWALHAGTVSYWAFIHERVWDDGEEIDEEIQKENETVFPSVPFMKQAWSIGQALNPSLGLTKDVPKYLETLLLQMEYEGRSVAETIEWVSQAHRISSEEATAIVERSTAWKSRSEPSESLRQAAVDMLMRMVNEQSE